MACVNASREILTRQIAIRTFNSTTPFCRMADFVALVAGLTLMLAHIVCHCHKETDNLLIHQRLGDRATVERTLECMQSMSELRDDVLAAKCATLLKDLLVVEADAAQNQSYRAHKMQWTKDDHEDARDVLIIKVPYLGAIRIAREGISAVTPLDMAQSRGSQEDITIGGIGSLHVNSPRGSDHSGSHSAFSVTAAQTSDAQTIEPLSAHQYATNSSQVASRDFPVNLDEVYPDAAAGIDDWVFQGFDTAFFDVLMRGAGDGQPHLANAENQDLGSIM